MQEAVHPDALTIFGATFDETMDDEIRVTVIATGFEEAEGAMPNKPFSAAAEKKAAPAPDTAQPQPIIRPIDEDFKTLLANTIEDAADDSGWAFLGIVGGVLTKKMPDFDPRNYGYKKLSLLVKSLSKIVEIEERPSENKELKLVYVRNRIR